MVKYIQNYALYEQIGSGVYGKVFRAINNNDKKEYAIKVIPIIRFKENKKLEECTVNEINILTNIQNHPNIIRYYDMLKTSNNFYFIYEYCNGSTLENLLSKQGKTSESNTLLILKQLLEAFKILNKYNIMHRDMKPDNIFFHNGVIKLGDFGFCKNLNSADQMTKTMLGSPIYMAPEVLKGQIYSNKADIWSLGVVLYEMIFGMCPFQSNSIANLIEVLNSKELQFPGHVSPFIKSLICRMLTKDPIRRISWMELFQININNKGEVQSTSKNHNLNNLQQVKVYDEIQSMGHLVQSNKMIPTKIENYGGVDQQPSRNFEKKKTTAPNQNQNQNQNHSLNHNQTQSQSNNNSSGHQISTTPKMSSKTIKQKSPLLDEHLLVLEGVKLSIEIVQNKIANHMGYGHLLLTKSLLILSELIRKTTNKDLQQILEKQYRDIENQRDLLDLKMFPYELKGLQDWKKYLRGKFFEEQTTIIFWYKMVTYLNGNYGVSNISQSNLGDVVKQILY